MPKTIYSLCISFDRKRLKMEGEAAMRYFLKGIMLLSVLVLTACDDGPEEVKNQPLQDRGIFQAEKATGNQSGGFSGKGIDRARRVSLDLKNDGLASLLKSIKEEDGSTKPGSETHRHKLQLNLFPDAVIVVELEASPGGAGLPAFFGGTVIGDDTSLVTLMHREGTFSGNIRYGDKLFRIRSEGKDQYRIEEVTPVALQSPKGGDDQMDRE
jgi:hypothetical protein